MTERPKMTEAQAEAERKKVEAQVDETFTAKGFHPVAKDILSVLQDDQAKWRQETTEDLFHTVATMLENVGKTEGVDKMIDAVMTMVSLSNEMHLREESKKAAIVVHVACHRVIEAHKLIDELRKKSFQQKDPTAEARKAVTGGPALDAARAPKLGEKPPEGTFKGGAIAPKRRI